MAGYTIGFYYRDEQGMIPEFYESDLQTAQSTTNLLNQREIRLYNAFACGNDFMRQNQHAITQTNYQEFRKQRDDLILGKLREFKLEKFAERTLRGEFFRYRYEPLRVIDYLEIA